MKSALPAFTLYREAGVPGTALLHIESIQSRSRLYQWEIDSHVHHGLHQVVWIGSGPVSVRLDESRSEGEGPMLVAIPPGVAHAFRFSPASDGFVLTVDARLLAEGDGAGLDEALTSLFAAPRMLALAAQAPATARLQALFDALHAEWQSGEPAPVAAWLARAIVWRLAEVARRDAVAPQRGGRQALYTRFVVLLEAHYLDHWPVTRYAERLGLNAERLNRMVRAETGQSVQALLHTRLLREACRRLLHVAAPVSRLAYELGFEDPAYFSRFFRRLTGLSPGAYRAQRQAGAGTGIAAATASMP